MYSVLLAGFLTVACLDDFNRDNDPMLYTPSYSIPIGPLYYTLEDIIPNELLGIPLPDTSTLGDSIPLIVYDDSLFFENSRTGYDTVFTGPINFSEISPNMEYARSLMFRMNYINEIPTDLAIQMYFFNANQLVDSLFERGGYWITQAETDQEGKTVSPFTGRVEVYVDSSRIDDLLQVNNYELSVHYNTYQEGLNVIHFYSDYGFDLQLALRAELVVPFE